MRKNKTRRKEIDMITTTNKTIQLPRELKKQWKISCCLSIKNNSGVYLLEGTCNNGKGILKIYQRNSFSKKKYRKVSLLKGEYLVLPEKHYCISGVHYVFYSKFTTLKDILCQNGISLWELLSLGIDLTHAATILYKNHIYEADISPNNIYKNKEGNFCLGDINIQKAYHAGTPGYIPPELTDTKKMISSGDVFDKAMQYSICKLLNSIYQLSESAKTEDITRLLDRGIQIQPDRRFHSLYSLREELEKQQKQLETDHHYQLLQVGEADHGLFREKTIISSCKENFLLYPVLWSLFVFTGCVFLVVLYQNLHSENRTSQKAIYLSQVVANSPTPSIKETVTVKKTVELDIRKKGITSFSSILSMTDHPENVVCLYAGENRLTDTSSIYRFSELQELYLDSNHIQQLSRITELKKLKILVLSYNRLTSLPDISELTSLEHLDLSSNPNFEDIRSLKRLTNLTTLNISETAISKKQYKMLCRRLAGCKIIY